MRAEHTFPRRDFDKKYHKWLLWGVFIKLQNWSLIWWLKCFSILLHVWRGAMSEFPDRLVHSASGPLESMHIKLSPSHIEDQWHSAIRMHNFSLHLWQVTWTKCTVLLPNEIMSTGSLLISYPIKFCFFWNWAVNCLHRMSSSMT